MRVCAALSVLPLEQGGVGVGVRGEGRLALVRNDMAQRFVYPLGLTDDHRILAMLTS
jgi:hypothetical protein